MTFYDFKAEISPAGEAIAEAYFKLSGATAFPVNSEMIASKIFGLHIEPKHQLISTSVISGIDASQSIVFIDWDIYMDDKTQHLARQAIAHEIGHLIYDAPTMRARIPSTPDQAFELHLELGGKSNIEVRANMFAGSLVVPRGHLLKKSAELLLENLEAIQLANPEMETGRVLAALGGAKLQRYFGVSSTVLGWRIEQEELFVAMQIQPDSPIAKLRSRALMEIIDAPIVTPGLTERIQSLLPKEILAIISDT